MNLTDIITATRSLAENDQSIPETDIKTWVDMGINRINTALQAKIPTVTGQVNTYIPEFDPRFHESLVIFSVAKYRESDSAYNDAQYFLQQFDEMVLKMQRDLVLLPSTINDYNHQQIIATSGTYTYDLTMPYGSYFDILEVYHNDVLMDSVKDYKVSIDKRTITITATVTITTGDKITIKFENNSDLNNPPYQWWNF